MRLWPARPNTKPKPPNTAAAKCAGVHARQTRRCLARIRAALPGARAARMQNGRALACTPRKFAGKLQVMDVAVILPGGRGWGPVLKLAEIAAEHLGGRLIKIPAESLPAGRLGKLATLLPPPRPRGEQKLLVIASIGDHLNAVLRSGVRRHYSYVAGWVIDSFWEARIPRVARSRGWYDHLYVTDQQDLDMWAAAVPCPVGVLPWGADVAGAQVSWADKQVELQRVGRQPQVWDDDDAVAGAAANAGVSFAGRPPFGDTDEANQAFVETAYRQAKAVLAFGTRTARAKYNHPTKDYVTARWTDSLAYGCLVAGQVPDTPTAREILPSFALVQLSDTDVAQGLEQLKAALTQYDEEKFTAIRTWAREHLDWRSRLDQIAADAAVN